MNEPLRIFLVVGDEYDKRKDDFIEYVDVMRDVILTLVPPDGFAQFGEWEGCPVCDERTQHSKDCKLARVLGI